MSKNTRTAWLFAALLSALFITIGSKCSFLCAFNDWYDPNCFFTVGKGMLHGLIPYRDLFEQKGPLLYFLHAIAYLVSPNSFLGVYLLELVSFSIALYFVWKIAAMYLEEACAFRLMPLFAFVATASLAFYKGDSAEEFCLPMLCASLYLLLRWDRDGRPQPRAGSFFLLGLMMGCIIWIKYSMLGFWIGYLLCVLCFTRTEHRVALLFRCAAFCGIGIALTTFPWLIYFGVNEAIDDWFYCYFYVNATVYAGSSLLMKPLNVLIGILLNCLVNPLISALAFLGIWRKGEKLLWVRLIPLLSLLASIYMGANHYVYYHLIVAPFSIFGFIRLIQTGKPRFLNRSFWVLTGGGLAIMLSLILLTDGSRYVTRKEALPQFQFAEVIRATPNATLLNYGFLDAGFYMAADVLPINRFFCRLNLPDERFPIMMDEQNAIIENASVDYVVIESSMIEGWDASALYENYEMVMETSLDKGYEGNRGYTLFRKKDGAAAAPEN